MIKLRREEVPSEDDEETVTVSKAQKVDSSLAPRTKMHLDQLDTPERNKQLENIDLLRALGVGDDISLPQIVVVGDQSSGKSSLLEGLTGLPFPVASQLCTRFATQVSFRRSATAHEDIVTVTIIPAADAEASYKLKLEGYKKVLKEITAETFGKVLDEAAVTMGLPGVGEKTENAAKRFSSDILRIEITGPKQQHLSVVDVPGLYHHATKDQTDADLATIRGLIQSYVSDRRTIIMAVLDSRNNLANQEIFSLAKLADPEGIRTIGIMTKLDALQLGDEPEAIKIAQNKVERLKLGWYCVRNRSTQEIKNGVTIEKRNQNEKAFFKTAPWNVLDSKRTGIDRLRMSLTKLLSTHIAREFPEIEKEVDSKYQKCRDELETLGPARETMQEQLQYLTKLSMVYQRHVEDVLMGRYWESGTHPTKLRMLIQNQSDIFSSKMLQEGTTMTFKNADDEPESPFTVSGPAGSVAKQNDIYEEIRELWRVSRGPELPGLINPVILETLFIHQTKKWEGFAKDHLDNAVDCVRTCNDLIMHKTCGDPIVRDRLLTRIGEEMGRFIDNTYDELKAILADERSPPLLTNNHYLAENLAAARHSRFIHRLEKMGFVNGSGYNGIINFESMKIKHQSNETSAVYEIHDMLKAYYKVAIKRFIDNVANQVIERNLLGPGGPISIFNPEWVAGLSAEDLHSIAGEEESTTEYRQDLSTQLARLDKARKICAGKWYTSTRLDAL